MAMKKWWFRGSLLATGVLFTACISQPARGETPTHVREAIEAIDWMTEQYPPFNYRDPEDGKIKGIAADILVEIFKKLGVDKGQQDLRLVPWARGYRAALEDSGSALFSTTYTKERLKLFKFVGPIVPTRVSLIAKKSRDLKVESVSDMEALRIGVIRDDVGDQLLRALGVKESAVVSKASIDNLVKMLYRDRLDAIAYAEDIVRHQSRLANLDPAECESIYLLKESHMGYAFHLSTDPAILKTLQDALDTLREDGTVTRIQESYLE